MIGIHLLQLRGLTSANGLRTGASNPEDSPGGRVDGAGDIPSQDHPLPSTSWLWDGNGREFGGWVDDLIMRLGDIQLAFPFILLAIMFLVVLGSGVWNLVLVLGVGQWVP